MALFIYPVRVNLMAGMTKYKPACKSPYFQLYIIIVKQYLIEQNLSGFCSISMQKEEGWHGEDSNCNLRSDCGSNRGNDKGGLKEW